MDAKKVKQLIEAVYAKNFATLSSAAKSFTDIMKTCSKEELKEISEKLDIKQSEAMKVSSFCKNRSRVIFACCEMFANIDGVACEYKVVAKDYRQKDLIEKSFNKIEDLKDKMLLGKIYKPYGYEKPVVELLPTEANYILKESDVASTTYAPFKIEAFTMKKVATAVIKYIQHCEKNGIAWNKDVKGNA